ncbi:MAG: Gfo/Idh/MocA family protein, partial [Planctomycetia bacterium]
ILEDTAVDGLVVATPDHWHALATVHGCMAGKHIYCEKPASHNVVEGRRMVDAARKYNRVVQIGTQRRSNPAIKDMVEFVQSGALGKIAFARAWITSTRPTIGRAKDEPAPPPGVDYDLWLGPAPLRPFNTNRFHYNWHWFWDYGAGELGNNGIHALDVARWALNLDEKGPHHVVSVGGKFIYDDDQETPDTQTVLYEYPDLTLAWEHRVWSPQGVDGSPSGVAIYGSKGSAMLTNNGWKTAGVAKPPASVGSFPVSGAAHVGDWLSCIRGGGVPSADVAIGHAGATLCHLGNVAQRVGRRLKWDGAQEMFFNDDGSPDAAANALLGREYRSTWPLPMV